MTAFSRISFTFRRGGCALLCLTLLLSGPASGQGTNVPQRALRDRAEAQPRTAAGTVTAGNLDDAGLASTAPGINLQTFIPDVMAAKNIPGLSAAIVREGQLYWSGEFGMADPTQSQPVTANTLFMLASISKTVTATALMQLYDQQLFDLDDPVAGSLPFSVTHPVYPSTAITFRMLLTHTGSIKDNWGIMPYYPGDSPYPLGTYLADYLDPAGALYAADKNYQPWQPGSAFGYSNIGLALVGGLVEELTGSSFDSVCEASLFAPLGMNATGWFLADVDPTQVAMPCSWNGSSYVPYGQYGYSDYPSGQLRTTAIELSRFLAMSIEDGQFGGATILQPATAQQMKTPQVPAIDPTQGLAWYTWNSGGRLVWGHGGGDQGVTTEMWFDPLTGIGVVALTNGEAYFPTIVDALFDYAEELPPTTSLTADAAVLSVTPANVVEFTIHGGTLNAGRSYLLLGSLSGTSPGTPLPGGAVTLPLQWDPLTDLIVANINSPMFDGFYGTLSNQGTGRASFATLGGLPTQAIGLTLNFAAALMGPWNFVTNPLTLQIGP